MRSQAVAIVAAQGQAAEMEIEPASAAAAYQTAVCVEEAVAQRLGFGLG